MKVQQSEDQAGHGVASTLTGAIEQTTAVVRQLDAEAGEAALRPLAATLERVRGARAQSLRGALGQLREWIELIRQSAEAGAELPREVRLHLHQVASRLHEAHLSSHRVAYRAATTAADLQRLCAMTSVMNELIGVLRGLGTQTSALVQGRRIAA